MLLVFMMGRMLARESKFKGDIVISVPDSGNTAATGFAYESGIPFCEGLIKKSLYWTYIYSANTEKNVIQLFA